MAVAAEKIRLAFLGFRHGHVMGLYRAAREHPGVEIASACDEHPETVAALKSNGTVDLTHSDYDEVFSTVDFDAVVVGDYFARRGKIIIRALETGKHVIADKPICTDLRELERIAQLAEQRGLSVAALLDLRDQGPYLTMRRLIRNEGAIGTVHTVAFTAQHPLMFGKRAAWYFEPGKHGGTINDIGIHGIDLIPWLTGRRIVECTAARAWNARLPQHPHFQDAGQVLLKLDNNGGVLGDVSYLTPDGVAYTAPQYWRVTCHGDAGLVETDYNAKTVQLARADEGQVQHVPHDPGRPTGVLDDFLAEVAGHPPRDGALTTRDVLDASRRALLIQRAAEARQTFAPLE
jgi:predicted dehydrogenase